MWTAWARSATSGSAAAVNIAGATGATYTMTQCRRRANCYAWSPATPTARARPRAASAATAAVANVNDAPTGSVTIDDTTPTQGQTLTAANTLADVDGLGAISYQWQRDGVNIAGATGSHLHGRRRPMSAMLSRVVASYTDGQGTAESVAARRHRRRGQRQRRAHRQCHDR